MSLSELVNEPFALLLEIERRARDAIARNQGVNQSADEWIGVAFRIGQEQFVTSRAAVREVLPAPEQVTRVPGAKPWLRGIANVRGQLMTIVDLKAFLGAGTSQTDRKARMLVMASRDIPTAIVVDEVLGFRRFGDHEFSDEAPATSARCDHYLTGIYERDNDRFPLFDLDRLLDDPGFLKAGQLKAG